MLNLSRKTVIFQNGGQTVNFETKVYRKWIKGLHSRLTKNKPEGNRTSKSRDIIDFVLKMLNLSRKTVIFQNGGRTVNFGTKVYRNWIKELHNRLTKIQTRRKPDK